MKRITNLLIATTCAGAVLVSGCARSRAARGTRDLPASFVPIEWAPGPARSPDAAAAPQEGCAIRLRDERDGTTLLLRRSENRRQSAQERGATVTRYLATGDYEVLTPGRYGLSAAQWLRVDCTTWRPIGPVSRTT
jgi:hypothetical protein